MHTKEQKKEALLSLRKRLRRRLQEIEAKKAKEPPPKTEVEALSGKAEAEE
jgi:hypothetical protein